MIKKKEETEFPSELRFDLISKDWVVIAKSRAKRPQVFKIKRQKQKIAKKDCPFCQITIENEPLLQLVKGKIVSLKKGLAKDWTVIVIPNKYPAFLPSANLNPKREGQFYQTINAAGFHEVLVTRDHEKQLAEFSLAQIKEVIDAYHFRYLDLMKERFVNYVSIFHNHGLEAGASVSHPHSQIVTTPLIDSDLKKALFNAKRYYKKERKCIYCQMNHWELKVKKRIIFENKEFLALCPFASKAAFEVIISPKKHLSYFEEISESQKEYLAEAFKVTLYKLYKGLSDPPYNFYLHTAPCDGKKYNFYHWHWTILPKTAIWAGFEIGTRMEISTIEPEKAAEFLRKQ